MKRQRRNRVRVSRVIACAGDATGGVGRGPTKVDCGGFTMVELLVTIVLLAIVLTGLAALQINVVRQVTSSKRASEATRLAQMVMERYKTMRYVDLVAQTPKATWNDEPIRGTTAMMTNVGSDGVSDGPFTVQTMQESISGGELVTVRVTWTAVQRGLQSTPSDQYQQYAVTLTTQRFQ